MKISSIFVFITILYFGLSFIDESAGFGHYGKYDLDGALTSITPAPDGYTGAPGEMLCYNCHGGPSMGFATTGKINYSFSGSGNEYVPNQTYTIDLGLIDVNLKNGFSMTILDATNEKAGSFISGTGSTVTNTSSREYIKHDDAMNNSWQFQWMAPSADLGDLTVYYAFNRSNNDNGVGGDTIFFGQEIIKSALASVTEKIKTEKKELVINVDQVNKLLWVNFEMSENSNVTFSLFDLKGRIVTSQYFGNLDKNVYEKSIDISSLNVSGIFIGCLSFGNNKIHQKIRI